MAERVGEGWPDEASGGVSSGLGRVIDPAPLLQRGRNWTRFAGPLVSLLILAAVAYQLRSLDIAGLRAMVPSAIGFWIAFAVYYLASPATEWIIFRRLWTIPVSGFAALLRKLVSNEILLGYLGELYFYAWARRNAHITAAPFGAIKDVTILSALVGNVVTLVMVAVAAPLFGALQLGMNGASFEISAMVVLGTSLAAVLLRNRLFTLPRKELWIIAGIHLARIATTTILAAVMWHLLLPTVALTWWLLLATLRQLLARLPLLPNKDIVFAGLATFLVGRDVEIVQAMALMATLILAAHLAVGAALGASEIAREARDR